MTFAVWDKGFGEPRIYINGVEVFWGKCFFDNVRGFAKLQTMGSILSLEQLDKISYALKNTHGISEGKIDSNQIDFGALLETSRQKKIESLMFQNPTPHHL